MRYQASHSCSEPIAHKDCPAEGIAQQLSIIAPLQETRHKNCSTRFWHHKHAALVQDSVTLSSSKELVRKPPNAPYTVYAHQMHALLDHEHMEGLTSKAPVISRGTVLHTQHCAAWVRMTAVKLYNSSSALGCSTSECLVTARTGRPSTAEKWPCP